MSDRESKLIAEFQPYKNWEERYKFIISLGKSLGDLPESLKTEESKVKGCQSQVWLHAKLAENGNMILMGDSDALIVKGLLAMVLRIYSDSPPAEVLKFQPKFLQEIGLQNHLSPSRSNGLVAMLRQIHLFATAFQYLKNSR